jgi:hypothetical protein
MSKTQESKTMIVIYDKANTCSLPYIEGEGKTSGVRFYKFKPGNNNIEPKVWDAIKEEILKTGGEEKLEHYMRNIKLKAMEGTRRGGVTDLSTEEFLKVIENTMTVPELENYKELEKGKTKGNQNKEVLKAIDAQLKVVKKADKELEDAQEGNSGS